MDEKIVYFEQPGKDNTEETLKLALERAKARGIKKVILASTWGDTAKLAAERWAGTGIKMVIVPHQYGFMFEPKQHFPEELVAELEKKGHKVHFASMLFHSEDFLQNNAARAIANMLRTFCQGMKVCVEIVLMSADAGLVATGEQVVVVAGTGRGSDTAIVAVAASSNHVGDLHVTEIICKPLQTKQGFPPPPPGALGAPPAPPMERR
ncbi:MAG TPA: pyruvate kinase alpha/beta domain-containing protein [Dehalococcoidales bacterium]